MEQIISADAARAYLHISKRKFLFMLQNGYIRYPNVAEKVVPQYNYMFRFPSSLTANCVPFHDANRLPRFLLSGK